MKYSASSALSGYRYQVVEALDSFVQMLENPSSIVAYRLEPNFGEFFGDAAAITLDGTLQVKEVKYSSRDRFLTWRALLGRDDRDSLLSKLASAFENLQNVAHEFTLHLVTNWHLGDDLKSLVTKEGILDWDRVQDAEVISRVEAIVGEPTRARSLFSRLRFQTDHPGHDEWLASIRSRFLSLGGSEAGWQQLEKSAYDWLFSNAAVSESMVREAALLSLQTEPTNAELMQKIVELQREMREFKALQKETQNAVKETRDIVKDQSAMITGTLSELEREISEELKGTVEVLAARLSEAQLSISHFVVEALKNDLLTDLEIKDVLDKVSTYLRESRQRGFSDPTVSEGVQKLAAVYDDTRVEAKHRLKLIAPLIPGILQYEREIELKTGISLGAVWDRLVAYVIRHPRNKD